MYVRHCAYVHSFIDREIHTGMFNYILIISPKHRIFPLKIIDILKAFGVQQKDTLRKLEYPTRYSQILLSYFPKLCNMIGENPLLFGFIVD